MAKKYDLFGKIMTKNRKWGRKRIGSLPGFVPRTSGMEVECADHYTKRQSFEYWPKSWVYIRNVFFVSQLDVANFENWDMPKKRFPEYISEMQTNVLEHFLNRVFLQKFDSLVWRLSLKQPFLTRMSSKFKNNREFWSTGENLYNDEEKSHGALI